MSLNDKFKLLGILKTTCRVQELSRLRNRNLTCNDTLATLEIELRTCRENLERTIADKECLQRQSASQLLDLDRLKQEKDAIELHQRVTERELLEVKDKLVASNRSLGSAGTNIAQQESTICQLKGKFLLTLMTLLKAIHLFQMR